MRKKIWGSLQIAWLVSAMFTTQFSILALTGNEGIYCSDYCASDDDCLSPCRCNSQDSMCYYPGELQSEL